MVKCDNTSTPAVPNWRKVCCVFSYDENGYAVSGQSTCLPIADAGDPQLAPDTISTVDCTSQIQVTLPNGLPFSVPYGEVKECCRDCNPPPLSLIVSNGRLVRNTGSDNKIRLNKSPNAEPEQCCCGDECACEQVPSCEQVRCYPKKDPTIDEKRRGHCVIRTYDETGVEIFNDRQVICATEVQCCVDDNTTCEPTCLDGIPPPDTDAKTKTTIPAANTWTQMNCTGRGICCVNNYDTDSASSTFRQVLSKTGRRDMTEAECTVTVFDPDDPDNPFGSLGVWYANTDNLNICNPQCCQTQTRGAKKATACEHTTATTCDPCVGRCIEIAREDNDWLCPRVECKTKQECCGDNNAKCKPQCGNATAAYRWEVNDCGTDGSKCGACCRIVYDGLDSSANVFSAACVTDIIRAGDCALNADDTDWLLLNPYYFIQYKWKPFETCETAKCGTKECCGPLPNCVDDVGCIDIDINAECDPCKSRCYAIVDETAECATKQECCGEFDEKCVPQVGFCPDSADSIPTHSWSGACADPELCGVCCKKKNDGTYTCDPTKTNQTDCNAEDYGVWQAFATCAACGNTAQACIESTCKRIVTVNGVAEDQTYTYAACKPVAPDKVNCKGVCTELSTSTNPYESKTCKTKSACCGSDNARCGDSCGAAATHSWDSSCVDPERCGVCCITTNNGSGNLTASCQDQPGITRATCEALNTANGGLGNTAVWVAFGLCRDCSIQRCCGECPDGSITCKDVIPPAICLQPCNGRCYTVDSAGNVDPTQPATCATKETCCMQGGINVCRNECKPGKRWTPTCPENAIKCGVACKTTFAANGTTILSSVCQPGITTYAQYVVAQAGMAANEALSWKPWDTCATVICQSKKCCKEKCPGELACVEVDISDPCKKCEGLCYDAVVDQATGAHSIAPGAVAECSSRVNCCGAGNEKCAEIPNCPKDNPKVFVACCDDDVFRACQCTGPNDGIPNAFSLTTPVNSSQGLPDYPGWARRDDYESCNSRLDGIAGFGQPDQFETAYRFKIYGDDSVLQGNPIRTQPTFEQPCDSAGALMPTFDWKDCYPGLAADQPLYVFTQNRRALSQVIPIYNTPVGQGALKSFFPIGSDLGHSVFQQKFTFYICQGKKLVDITAAVLKKLTVHGCSTVRTVFERTCYAEVIVFEVGDADVLGLPGRDNGNLDDLSGYGEPGYRTGGGISGLVCPTSTCISATRYRRGDQIAVDQFFNGTKFRPLAADIRSRFSGEIIHHAGDPRPVYGWIIPSLFSPCTAPVPAEVTVSTQTDVPDAFDLTIAQTSRSEWAEPAAAGPPTVFNGHTIPADCCRLSSAVITTGPGVEDGHDWQGPCGVLFDNALPDDKMLGCPQEFTENPLP